jgi:unsaturated rhamnogalacturonyl hydrolase
MKITKKILAVISFAALPAFCQAAPLTVTAVNPSSFARASQTIELSAKQLAPVGEADFAKIHVQDAAGKELLCQAVDTDFDDFHKPDMIIFQSDFAPGESKKFTVTTGAKQVYTPAQFKAYGRFVRERFDDFAWENDRIAHRTYGKALITWKGEPLTSSSIDIWSKRTPHMVIDEWYMADNYHADTGEGADFYSAGATTGNGGDGLWFADKLWQPINFVNSRVLANGPIRVLFELDYEAYDVHGMPVSETRRVSLDAGQNLDHYQVFYKPAVQLGAEATWTTSGVGLKKVAGEQKDFNAEHGWLSIWEKMEKNQGMQGVALVVDPKKFDKQAETKTDNLLLLKTAPDNSVSYWAGFYWDKSGQFADDAAWKKYVDEFAQGVATPIQLSVQ